MLAALVAALTIQVSLVQAAQSPRPVLRVTPSTVGIGKSARLIGHNLQAATFYTLLFVIPNTSKLRIRRFLGLARSDARGTLNVPIRMPVISICGRAAIYAYRAGPRTTITAPLKLTGCAA